MLPTGSTVEISPTEISPTDLIFGLIVAQRHHVEIFDCRVALRPSGALLLPLECGATAVAVDVDLEDRGVMDEVVDCGERHGGGSGKTCPQAPNG